MMNVKMSVNFLKSFRSGKDFVILTVMKKWCRKSRMKNVRSYIPDFRIFIRV